MELLFGFALGFLASALAGILLNSIPAYRQRPFLASLRNPRLLIRLRLDTEERRIKRLIETLFDAWEERDPVKYRSCWAEDAVRVVGPKSDVVYHLSDIQKVFSQALERYLSTEVVALIFDAVELLHAPMPKPQNSKEPPAHATAQVHYRLKMVRLDSLPEHEEATEFYTLKRVAGLWRIASNLDHSQDIQR